MTTPHSKSAQEILEKLWKSSKTNIFNYHKDVEREINLALKSIATLIRREACSGDVYGACSPEEGKLFRRIWDSCIFHIADMVEGGYE